MSTSGSAQTSSPASLQAFLTNLVINAAVAGAEFCVFLVLRRIFKQIYEPRTFLIVDEDSRSPPLGPGLFSWFKTLYHTPDIAIYERTASLDAYVYVRFLKLNVIIFGALALLAVPILIPVNVANQTPAGNQVAQQGLLKLTIGNVSANSSSRYAAHIIMLYIFTFFILYMIQRELKSYIGLRQDFLTRPRFVQSAQANTILITGIPQDCLNETKLREVCSVLPGQVLRVWIHRNYEDLPDLWSERNKDCKKLEGKENALAETTVKHKLKYTQKCDKAARKNKPTKKYPEYPFVFHDGESEVPVEKGTMIPSDQIPLLSKKDRPSHWQWKKWMPFGIPHLGKKVDSIDYFRSEIVRLNGDIAERRNEEKLTSYKPTNSAFVLFDNQIAAQLACQVLLHHEPFRMTPIFTEVAPADVIWDNLNMTPYERELRKGVSLAGMIGLCVAWSFITAFIGAISTITGLAAKVSWLHWLLTLPSVVQGIISGILPPVLQAVLQLLLIIFLRQLSIREGIPRHSTVELSLMTKYFVFLVLFSFILLTFASSLIDTVPKIVNDPSSAASILANNLPSASTYFINYIILQGLSGAGGSFMRIAALIVYYIKMKLLASTPRSVYAIQNKMPTVTWGTTWPLTTLLTVIGLVYSIIAPLVTIFAAVAFLLYYVVNRYLFLYVYNSPPSSETGGLFFPKAIGHIFTALYIEMVALAGLFFLAQDASGHQSALPEGIFAVILIVITIAVQIKINQYFNPLYVNLPVSLAGRSHEASKVRLDQPGKTDGAASQMTSKEQSQDGNMIGRNGDGNGTSRVHNEAPQISVSGASSIHDPNTQNVKDSLDRKEGGEKGRYGGDSTLQPPTTFNRTTSSSSMASNRSRALGVHDLDANSFTHPSAYAEQPIIWLAQDPLGITTRDASEIREMKIAVDTEGAFMDDKGKVSVTMEPPDEDEVRHPLLSPDEAWQGAMAGAGGL